MGLFWKKTSNKGAIYGALSSIPIAMFLKIGPKGWFSDTFLNNIAPTFPFMDQMAVTSILTMIIIAIVSYNENKENDDLKGIKLEKGIFNTSSSFNIGSFALMIILTGIYSIFW